MTQGQNILLELSAVSMSFKTDDGDYEALANINLKMPPGEFVSLIGHSGCGKSTVLNIVGGLLEATKGGVILNGREVSGPGPERAIVFQNHALLPWLNVWQNVELAAQQVFRGKKTRAEIRDWTAHHLALVQMLDAAKKRPHEISGGMKQRVGIARALAMQPDLLLMDEPFGALDALTRAHLQDSLMALHQELGMSAMMITHDVDEAVLLSDRILMMTVGPSASVGEILNVDLPRPRNRVALAQQPEYHRLRQAVLQFLYGSAESNQHGDAKSGPQHFQTALRAAG